MQMPPQEPSMSSFRFVKESTLRFMVLIVVIMAMACSSASTPDPEHGGSVETGDDAMLQLAELRFTDTGGDTLLVHDDGRIESDGRVVGTVRSDGTLIGPDGGVALTLHEDGTITSGDGQTMPVTVDAEGTLRSDTDQELRFADDGTIVGSSAQAPTVTVSGLTSATRRTAMFILAGLLLPVRAPNQPEAVESEE